MQQFQKKIDEIKDELSDLSIEIMKQNQKIAKVEKSLGFINEYIKTIIKGADDGR